MPTGKPGSGKAEHIPQPFQVFYDPHRSMWAVRQGERWRFTHELCIQVNTLSIGRHLTGVGVVRSLTRGNIVVTS